MLELDSVIKEFLVESYENLDQLDRDLVALEKDPQNRERLSSIFRTIHTIKGTCGFFGFARLESVTHVGENLLSRLRDGLLVLDPERTSALLALDDAIRVMLGNIESTGADGDGDYQELIERLTRLQEQGDETATSQAEAENVAPAKEASSRTETPHCEKPAEAVETTISVDPVKEHNGPADRPAPAANDAASGGESKGGAVSDTNIRVDVGLLDKLMNLVGELVLARNQILQFSAHQKDTSFLNTTQRLNLITTELQEGVMKTRMQPIGNVWNRFPRVVRDLAVACGKQVRLQLEGKETELDKTIIEAIKDPLTHIVRNSVDHGIEKPEARVAAGKPAVGTLLLRAFHEGGQVNIEIIDDGAGINIDRVKAKALERGLITREQAARLSDREASHLIFLPGFSTAEKITNVSGRGVGMDVVKTNIEKIGGSVDLQSQYGTGTTLKIKIPLTLAIIPALIVTSGGDRYAIPQVSLIELVRLDGDNARKGIEMIHNAPVYRLRGRLLPLVYLNNELSGAGEAGGRALPEPATDSLDFARARDKHLEWKSRMRAVLQGVELLSLDQLKSHRHCDLGKWIYSTGMSRYGHMPDMVRLEMVHETMHATCKQMISYLEQGRRDLAEAELPKIDHLSDDVVSTLSSLERDLTQPSAINIVVLQADDRQFGLVVEGINDTEEIVVKPLGQLLKGLSVFAGATIMGDGRVALILDVLGIAQKAGVISEVRDRALTELAAGAVSKNSDRQTLLLLGTGTNRRAAIPLNMVARLEEIPTSEVEISDHQEVVQYRGQIMPLIRLSGILGNPPEYEQGSNMQVVVYSENGRSIGLVVDRIVDIVESTVTVQPSSRRDVIVGSVVIQNRVTDLFDIQGIINRADPNFFLEPAAAC